ncbi:hypothetical protein BCR35DRAFT_35000 [Leucosporidium creatinivorum]|uniref:Uncharacterized protein n=1 Tax=Leucosporidium creatinivorum TaxID=106004 RepID=A0A1Y2CDB2_9BASI|nr:hypothetical protein BCR35DRAFT_35000 [Leucosporidium creatinivorum]
MLGQLDGLKYIERVCEEGTDLTPCSHPSFQLSSFKTEYEIGAPFFHFLLHNSHSTLTSFEFLSDPGDHWDLSLSSPSNPSRSTSAEDGRSAGAAAASELYLPSILATISVVSSCGRMRLTRRQICPHRRSTTKSPSCTISLWPSRHSSSKTSFFPTPISSSSFRFPPSFLPFATSS